MKAGLVFSLLLSALPSASAAPGDAVMIYWAAGDCGPCKLWSATERRREFAAEAERLGIALVEVSRPRLADPLSSYAWPASHAGLAQQMQALPAPQFTPSFDFVCKGQLQRRLAGLADWDSFWRKSARQLARDCR